MKCLEKCIKVVSLCQILSGFWASFDDGFFPYAKMKRKEKNSRLTKTGKGEASVRRMDVKQIVKYKHGVLKI